MSTQEWIERALGNPEGHFLCYDEPALLPDGQCVGNHRVEVSVAAALKLARHAWPPPPVAVSDQDRDRQLLEDYIAVHWARPSPTRHFSPAPEARVHRLKTWPEHFRNLRDGFKTFEVRENDRDFREGDVLALQEWDPKPGLYTAATPLLRGVAFLLDISDRCLKPTVVMGLQPVIPSWTERFYASQRF